LSLGPCWIFSVPGPRRIGVFGLDDRKSNLLTKLQRLPEPADVNRGTVGVMREASDIQRKLLLEAIGDRLL
jgi:hypothetical protein